MVTVVIPNWNGREFLDTCLRSLADQTFKKFTTIMIDNGSTDGSIEFIRQKFPKVKIIKFDKNCGFAAAVNAGIRSTKTKFVALLNNDTQAEPNWLEALVTAAKVHPEADSIASKTLNFNNRDLIDGAGCKINEVGQARTRGFGEKDRGQYNTGEYVFCPSAGAALYRMTAFAKIGLFDEDYFAYFEDVDWGFRAQLAGFKCWYEPTAVVFHRFKGTSVRIPKLVEYLQFRNMTMTILKDMPAQLIFRKKRLLKIILVHLNTFLYFFLKGNGFEAVKVEYYLLTNLAKILRKRAKIQKARRVNCDYLERFLEAKPITFWGVFR